jgi:hypothetical protein
MGSIGGSQLPLSTSSKKVLEPIPGRRRLPSVQPKKKNGFIIGGSNQ